MSYELLSVVDKQTTSSFPINAVLHFDWLENVCKSHSHLRVKQTFSVSWPATAAVSWLPTLIPVSKGGHARQFNAN